MIVIYVVATSKQKLQCQDFQDKKEKNKGSFFLIRFVQIPTCSHFSSIFPLKIFQSLFFENSRLF